MHIKFTSHGKGSARRAADYLTQKKDSKGDERPGIEVLRGDPYDVAYVSDNLSFLNRYRMGVIGWASEDQPTETQINEVLDEFELTAFAGLDLDRFTWSAVLHKEAGGGCHVHVFFSSVDLLTGKSHNVAPPGWIQTYQPLRDYFNAKYGWARPDDPSRRQVSQKPRHELYIEAEQLRSGLEVEENPRDLIRDYLLQRIISGSVVDRPSMVVALHQAGLETPRLGKNYITAYDPGTGGKWRLKGAIYDEKWTAAEQEIAADIRDGAGVSDRPNAGRAARAWLKIEAKRHARAEYNQQRYKLRDPSPTEPDKNADNGGLDTAPTGRSGADDGAGTGQLGPHHILLTPDRRKIFPGRSGQRDSLSAGDQRHIDRRRQPGEIYGVARGTDYCRRVENEWTTGLQNRESVRRYDPDWHKRTTLQRQYYVLYKFNIEQELVEDFRLWENDNGRFLINNHKNYHVWDKGDKLILRRASGTDIQVAVALMLRLGEDKGWDLRERAELATGTPEFLVELRRQVAERLSDGKSTSPHPRPGNKLR